MDDPEVTDSPLVYEALKRTFKVSDRCREFVLVQSHGMVTFAGETLNCWISGGVLGEVFFPDRVME